MYKDIRVITRNAENIDKAGNGLNINSWLFFVSLLSIPAVGAVISVIYASPLPFFIVLAVLSLIPVVLIILVNITPRVLLGFYLFSRLILASFPGITHQNIIGPLSIMKLHAAGSIIFGLLYLIYKKEARLDWLAILFFIILSSLLVTTVYHHTWFDFLESAMKWCYLWLIIVLTRLSISDLNFKKFSIFILSCYAYAILNFLYSVFSGKMKCVDEVCRFVGTYKHQAEISFILLTIVPVAVYLVVVEKEFFKKWLYIAILFLAHIGIYSTSYRTTWMSLCLYWIVFLIIFQQAIQLHKKVLATFLVFVALGFMFMPGSYISKQITDRLAPIAALLQAPSDYLETASSEAYRTVTGKPYVDRTENNLLLSGRIGDWKALLIGYRDAPIEEKILGMGVGMDKNIMARYKWGMAFDAHNIYIESLVETGVLGFAALLVFLLVVFIKLIPQVKKQCLPVIISAPIFFSYVAAGLAENALDNINPIVCLGLYLGIALYYQAPHEQRIAS